MLVDQLSIAYKCHSSIGNSINLKEMIREVLKTFVTESYAIYGQFCLINEEGLTEKFHSFGKMGSFDSSKYIEYKEQLSIIDDKDIKILKIRLDNSVIFLVSKKLNVDCSYFISMFESLIPKLNLSVNACLNYDKLMNSNILLKEQKNQLIKANKTKDDFLANMSHELKTPLNSITLISSIMSKNKSGILGSKEVKNMEIIKKCADDLTTLINDILDISKIEAGELKIHKDSVDLKNIINELFDSFEPIAKDKKIGFINNFNIENSEIFTDEARIKQIMKNLLSNALKFTNIGQVEILSEEFEDCLKVSVIDSGIGISDDFLPIVFDRFKQVDNSRTRKYKGTGLGLAISKELANLLNSDLIVTSKINVGTTFTYIIPKKSYQKLLKDNKQKNEEEASKEKESSNNGVSLDKKIYILHSNSVEQFKLTIALKKYDLNVSPILNESKIEQIMNEDIENKYIFLIDSRIKNFENILNEYAFTKDNLICLVDDKSLLDDELFNKIVISNDESVDLLIEHFQSLIV